MNDYKIKKRLVCGKMREFVLMPTYNRDIKELWQEIAEDKDSYYVYSYGRIENDGMFLHRYIGIGGWTRYKKAKRHNNVLMGNMAKNQYYKIIVAKCDTREGAAAIEQNLISFFGRKDIGTGDLYNLSDGGEAGATGAVRSAETRAKMSAAHIGKTLSEETRAKLSAAKTKNKSHINDEILFNYLQSCKVWKEEIPSDWGVSYKTLQRMFKKRYGTGSATRVQKILGEKLGKRILNHANFIEYCRFHKYEFLQMAPYYFGISGESLQRWCLRTYSKADSNTINGWEKRANRLERERKSKAKRRASNKN